MPSNATLRLILILLCSASPLFAQGHSGASAPPGNDSSALNLASAMASAAPKEADAYRKFEKIPDAPLENKVKAGEDFLKKYPKSGLVPYVYAALSVTYIEGGQADKGFAAGEQALALNPNDTRTLANLAQSMARLNNSNSPDAAQNLQKAEQFAQKCIQITPTLARPESVSEPDFAAINDKNLAMAHSALGTVNIRGSNYAQAMPDLQEAVKLDGGKDATNLYLLGVASINSDHYAEAVDAFTKCAANAPANLQKACEDNAAQAKASLAAKPAAK